MYRYLRMTFISILTEKQEHLPKTHTHTRLTHSDSARIHMYTGALTHNAHTHTAHSLRQRTYTHVHRSTYPQRTYTRLTHSDSARIHMYTGALTHNAYTHTAHSLRQRTYTHVHRSKHTHTITYIDNVRITNVTLHTI